ncbi:MAG TPA: RNA polymerase sigma factor [Planctomycetaceae bacterium]
MSEVILSEEPLSEDPLSEETVLVRGCLAGNADCYQAFVQRFQSAVFGLCFRMLSHREDAEDVAQEVFLRAYRSLAQWDSARPLKPWLLAIAANRCRTWLLTRKRRDLPAEYAENVAGPSAAWMRADLAEELQLALDGLREEYRLCFVLYHLNDLNLAEIASIVESPEGTVKTWLRRARQELAEHLQRRSIFPQVIHELP